MSAESNALGENGGNVFPGSKPERTVDATRYGEDASNSMNELGNKSESRFRSSFSNWFKKDSRSRVKLREAVIDRSLAKTSADSRRFLSRNKSTESVAKLTAPGSDEDTAYEMDNRSPRRSQSQTFVDHGDLSVMASHDFQGLPLQRGAHRTVAAVEHTPGFIEAQAGSVAMASADFDAEHYAGANESRFMAGEAFPADRVQTHWAADYGRVPREHVEYHERGQFYEMAFSGDEDEGAAASLDESMTVAVGDSPIMGNEDMVTKAPPSQPQPRMDSFPVYINPSRASQTPVNDALKDFKWGENPSDLINPYVGPQKAEIPDCTANEHPKYWKLTNSTLQAYNAMRGPREESPRDLFTWTDRCAKTYKKPEDCNDDIGTSVDIAKMMRRMKLAYPPAEEDPAQKEVYMIPRPPFQHLKAPAGFKASDHDEPDVVVATDNLLEIKREIVEGRDLGCENTVEELKACTEKQPVYREGDLEGWGDFCISDDEGDQDAGRISPCTFRLWAEGCTRWDVGQTSNIDHDPTKTIITEAVGFEKHWDPYTCDPNAPLLDKDGSAAEMAGEYLTPSENPYLLEVTESEIADNTRHWTKYQYQHPASNFQNNFHQAMAAPKAPDASQDPLATVSESVRTFTKSEVEEALMAEDAPLIDGVPAKEAEQVLNQRLAELMNATTQEQVCYEQLQQTQERLIKLEAQFQRIEGKVDALIERQHLKKLHRNEAVYQQVGYELQNMRSMVASKEHEFKRLKDELVALHTREANVKLRMRMLAREAGIEASDPDQIEAELQKMLDNDVSIKGGDADESECF